MFYSTEKGLIGIELNATFKDYLHARNMAFHCDNYAHYTLVGKEYTEDLQIIQINFTYELMKKEETKKLDLDIVEVYEMQNSKDKRNIEKYKYLIYDGFKLKRIRTSIKRR